MQRQLEPEEEHEEEELLQRQELGEDEEDEPLQASPVAGAITHVSAGMEGRIRGLKGGGAPLPGSERNYFEPRLGVDLGSVRVHTTSGAQEMASDLGARAFTRGRDIVFGAGQYCPGTVNGRHLLAHELTHVIQQVGSPLLGGTIQRTVRANSRCPANVHGAPANPIAALQRIEGEARRMALGCSHLLFLESITFSDPTFGRSEVFNAYRDWFMTPAQTRSGQWRSRFRRASFATEEQAMAHEMRVLSRRFNRIYQWFGNQIRYVCPGTRRYRIPGCAAGRCRADAETCPGSRVFGICPGFWTGTSDGGRASLLIHEAIHALYRFRGHPTSTARGRARNPGCYQGFVDTIYNTGATPGQCNAVMHFAPFVIPLTSTP